jgi:hypothetical protein
MTKLVLASVNEKQVNTQVAGHVLHVFRETLEVPPISAIVLLLEMPLEPTMGISLNGVSLAHYTCSKASLLSAGQGAMPEGI